MSTQPQRANKRKTQQKRTLDTHAQAELSLVPPPPPAAPGVACCVHSYTHAHICWQLDLYPAGTITGHNDAGISLTRSPVLEITLLRLQPLSQC